MCMHILQNILLQVSRWLRNENAKVQAPTVYNLLIVWDISTSYNMAARALADLSHDGAKRPSAINQLSARAAML